MAAKRGLEGLEGLAAYLNGTICERKVPLSTPAIKLTFGYWEMALRLGGNDGYLVDISTIRKWVL